MIVRIWVRGFERLRDQKTGQSARGESGGTIFHVISKYSTYQHK